MDRGHDVATEKEEKLDAIVKSTAKAAHEGAGFGTTASIATDKDGGQDSIVKGSGKSMHGGAGFATTGSVATAKDGGQDSIVKGSGKSMHGGAGFATTGSVATDKDGGQDSIVKGAGKSLHGGAGFATTGSIAIAQQGTSHGIMAPGTKSAEGPIASSADAINRQIAEKEAKKGQGPKEAQCRAFLESVLGEKFSESTLQEALADGQRLLKLLAALFGKKVKINKGKLAFAKRENVSSYIEACGSIDGFNKYKIFDADDLIEGRAMSTVYENLLELQRLSGK